MADIIYLTLNGNKQGLISAGCSSYDSIGNRYQNNHSDEILVYSTDYDISRHQNISHAPFVFEKADDSLFYFIFPYFLSLFAWYTHIYFDLPKNSNLGSSTEYFYSGNIRNSGSNRSYC